MWEIRMVQFGEQAFFITNGDAILWKDGSIHHITGYRANMTSLTDAPGYWSTRESAQQFLAEFLLGADDMVISGNT